MPNQAEEIKSRLDLVEIIREYVQLKAVGVNFQAKCPFHREKTPSFVVSPERQIWKCFGCFPRGSLIKTEQGLVKIENIKKNNIVMTDKGNAKKVILTMVRDYKGETINIQTRKINEIVSMTADHEIYVVKTKNCKQKSRLTRLCQSRCKQNCPTKYFKEYGIEKITAKNLTKNDYLIYPIIEKTEDIKILDLKKYLKRCLSMRGKKIRKLPNKLKIDNNFLKLLGYYIAEGSNHRAYIRFSLGPHELKFAKEIQKIIKTIFNLDSGIHIRKKNKTGIEITCCNSNLANIFENLCGKGAINKHIPFELNYLPYKKQKVILEAMFRGDGHISKEQKKVRAGEKKLTTTSRILAEQIKDILLRLSFQPGLTYEKSKIDKRGTAHKPSYVVKWREDLKGNYSDFLVIDSIKYWLLPIRNISKNKFKGDVYNLTVKDDHSYIANHFAVGNCGKGGDVFTFLMEMDGLSFVEALRQLAPKAGVQLQNYNPQESSKRNRLLDIMDLAVRYYHQNLLKSPEAESVRGYLKNRGLKPETIEDWQIGYSPDSWDSILNLSKNKGFSEQEIFLAGLAVKKEQGSGFYDRFRGRIMFPINDVNGNPVAFSARVDPAKEESEKMGKYINSPQTILYDKSKILFGLDKAKQQIREQGSAIVAEGQMDVISSHQAGVKNIVASSGTALSIEQLNLIKRYTNSILFSFDVDAAGQIAAERGIEQALRVEMDIKVVQVPDGKDPDDCIRNSPEEWKKAIQRAISVLDYYFQKTFINFNINDIQQKKLAAGKILRVVNLIANNIERDFWLQKLSAKLSVSEQALRESLTQAKKKRQSPSSVLKKIEKQENIQSINYGEVLGSCLLALILKFNELHDYVVKQITPSMMTESSQQSFYKKLIIYYNNINNENFDYQQFKIWLRNSVKDEQELTVLYKMLDTLTLLADKEFYHLDIQEARREVNGIISQIKRKYSANKMLRLEQDINQAEAAGDAKQAQSLLGEFKIVAEELNRDQSQVDLF